VDEVVIELLHLPDQTRSHAKVGAFPANIGRGYENQVVLYDPEVSAVHARLEKSADGALLLVDAGSTNGVLVGEEEKKVSSVEVTDGLVVRLGNTELVFKRADSPREKTVVSRRVWRLDPLGSKRLLAAAGVVLVGLVLFQNYRGAVAELDPGDQLGIAFMTVVMCLMYAALWSVLGRLVTQVWRYLPHLNMGLLGFASFALVSGLLGSFVTFAFDAPRVSGWLVPLGAAVVAFAMVQAHLQRAVNWTPKRARIVAGVLVLTVLGVFGGRSLLSREPFSSSLPLEAEALPPSYRLVSARPVSALLDATTELKASVDELAKQE